MKIEKLDENKIRITLNIEDLHERNIDTHSFMSNSIESQSIFLDMLNTAEKEVGFKTDNCRIMIEAIALKDGSFILTITKVAQDENIYAPPKIPSRKKVLHIKRKIPTVNTNKTIYRFENFDTFCDFCTFLSKSTYKDSIIELAKDTSLYEYNSSCYLILSNIHSQIDLIKFLAISITEFAYFVENPEIFERKLTEYGKPIIKNNAIVITSKYFLKK